MRIILALLLFALLAAPARAQILPTPGERLAADIATYGTVAAALALDFKQGWQSDDRVHATELFGARLFTVWVTTTLFKEITHRQRPCAPDCGVDRPDTSFPSGHTAFAFSVVGGPRLSVSFALGGGTAAGRVLAGKHHKTDVIAGAVIGLLTSRIR